MSAPREIGDPASLGRAVDELIGTTSPTVFALGEPTHGIAAFPLLRNDILKHLVERGYRSIVLETDFGAASVVDDYIVGDTTSTDIDTVLATGFSHGFGAIPGNRELVEWLRDRNAGLPEPDRVHFHGFDAPVEYSGAPSPRHALSAAIDQLPEALRPASSRDVDALFGADLDWTNEAAMYDATASIGDSDRARALRVVADDVVSALHRAVPHSRTGRDHARTAVGLLRYHAAMASESPDRIALLLSIRAEMMAGTLLSIVEHERRRGPCMVFAHNGHLHPNGDPGWANAGTLVAAALGDRYLFVATDASPDSDPDTLQRALADATTRRALFGAAELRASVPPSIGTSAPIVQGHIPLRRQDLDGTDAVIFIADTDGQRQRYW